MCKMPSEFWRRLLERDPRSTPGKIKGVVQIFDRYTVFVVIDAKKVKFQQRYQKSHSALDSGIVGSPLDADPVDALLICLFNRVQ